MAKSYHNYLLDSHVLIWMYFESNRLSTKTKKILADPQKTVFVSSVTFWEVSIKYASGKLQLKDQTLASLVEECKQSHLKFLNINIEDASTMYRLDADYHKDPFDRMLIWQAVRNNMVLITNDPKIHLYKSIRLKCLW